MLQKTNKPLYFLMFFKCYLDSIFYNMLAILQYFINLQLPKPAPGTQIGGQSLRYWGLVSKRR